MWNSHQGNVANPAKAVVLCVVSQSKALDRIGIQQVAVMDHCFLLLVESAGSYRCDNLRKEGVVVTSSFTVDDNRA